MELFEIDRHTFLKSYAHQERGAKGAMAASIALRESHDCKANAYVFDFQYVNLKAYELFGIANRKWILTVLMILDYIWQYSGNLMI